MFRKKPVLEYQLPTEICSEVLIPAAKNVPNWYKNIPKFKNNEIFNMENGFNHTVKNCVPVLNSLTSGYFVVLPQDIYVKNNNGEPYIAWKEDNKFTPNWRKEVADLNLVPFEHYAFEYTWSLACAIKVPIGYSMLVTHPFNRHDLPFTTLTGILDGGFVTLPNGNIPFYIKKGYEGIIPKGTPIVQLIPFFQENWISKKNDNLLKISEQNKKETSSVLSGWYKKKFWIKKNYL